MKKINLLWFLMGLLLTIGSCTREQLNSVENSLLDKINLMSQIKVNESTTMVSDIFVKMGVSKISVTNDNNVLSFTSRTERLFIMNGEPVNLSEFEVVISDDFVYLKSNPDLKITLVENQPYILSEEYKGFLSQSSDDILNLETSILLIYINELTLDSTEKYEFFEERNLIKGCRFMDTYYVYGTGVSKSVSEDRLESEITRFEMYTCSPIGEEDTTCLFGSHFCLTSQAFCCE